MIHSIFTRAILLFFLTGWMACGNSSSNESATTPATSTTEELTPEQLQHGIGPIAAFELGGDIDTERVARGETIFTTKCGACHKLDQRYVGPLLGDVLSRRTPAYVMNMTINPEEMIKRHPEAKALMAEYLMPMPFQNVTEEEARDVLEYLRAHQIQAAEVAQ